MYDPRMRSNTPDGDGSTELRRAAVQAEREQLASMPGVVKAARILLWVQLLLGVVSLLMLFLAEEARRSYGFERSSSALVWTGLVGLAWLLTLGWLGNSLTDRRPMVRTGILILEAFAMLMYVVALFNGGSTGSGVMLELGLAFAVSICVGGAEAEDYFNR